jgi:hypothetical protein
VCIFLGAQWLEALGEGHFLGKPSIILILCAFSWVHNGWRLSVRDIFLGKPSIILIGPL